MKNFSCLEYPAPGKDLCSSKQGIKTCGGIKQLSSTISEKIWPQVSDQLKYSEPDRRTTSFYPRMVADSTNRGISVIHKQNPDLKASVKKISRS